MSRHQIHENNAKWDDYYPDAMLSKLFDQPLSDPRSCLNFSMRHHFFYEGDPSEFVYLIASGQVMLSKSLSDGRRQVVGLLGPDDVFGLSDAAVHGVSAETLTDVQLRRFDRSSLETASALRDLITKRMERQVCKLQDHALLLGRKNSTEKVATFLSLCTPLKNFVRCSDVDEQKQVAVPLTRRELADYLGLTYETTSRVFSNLKQVGIITYVKGHEDLVTILKPIDLAKETGDK